ncbi:MAG: zinc ribbon domain-containing protein [Chloroflexi bacterium]|nr:zinc ribbon domain-containing protein [Chloroflexota bacterium]
MPIYEYQCTACGNKFDKFVRPTAEPQEVACPKCGSLKTEKTFSVFGVSGGTRGAGSTSSSSCGPTGG